MPTGYFSNMVLQGYSSDNVLKINVISIVFPTLNYKTKYEAYLVLEAYRWNLESWSIILTLKVFLIYFLILIFIINTSPVMLPSSMLYLTGMLFWILCRNTFHYAMLFLTTDYIIFLFCDPKPLIWLFFFRRYFYVYFQRCPFLLKGQTIVFGSHYF